MHGDFALNDLLLEVSQVFDQQTVRDLELTCLQHAKKQEWQLSSEFKLVTRRNKESDNVVERLEEYAFRSAG